MKSALGAIVLACLTLGGAEVLAQMAAPSETRTVVLSQGSVFVDRQLINASTVPVPLKADSTIRTEEGRAEVALDGGAILFLGPNSTVRGIDDRFSVTGVVGQVLDPLRMEMLGGSAVVWTRGARAGMQCENRVTLSEFGVFRFDFNPSNPRNIDDVCSFKVFGGNASVYLASLRAHLDAGTRMGLNRHCGDMIPTHDFDIGIRDELDRWSLDRMRLRDAR